MSRATTLPRATTTRDTDADAGTERAPLRLTPPPLDPPFDDEWSAARPGWVSDGALALSLPLVLVAPRPVPRPLPGSAPGTTSGDWPTLRLVKEASPGAAAGGLHPLPPPGPRARQLVRAVLEVLAGDRPARHLSRVTASDVLEQVEEAIRTSRKRPWAHTIRSLHLAEPNPGVVEVTAVVDRGQRCAAIGMRLAGLDGRWIITEIALG